MEKTPKQTLTVVDEITETSGRVNKQGVANVTTGFFVAMGGCAVIGQSIINVSSWGRTRISGIVAAVALILFVIFSSSFIEKVQKAALVSLMFMAAIWAF